MRFEFGEFVLDTDARELLRGALAVRLSPKAFQLLEVLVTARPKALGKDALMQQLWPDTFVVEANLSNLVGELRSALGDTAQAPRFVRTVHRFGYAFIDGSAPRGHKGAIWRLSWRDGQVELPEGTHVLGRGGEAVRLVARSVSRAHARVIVAPDHLTYEDLGSKNGSFRDGRSLDGVIEVSDGDAITVGAVVVTFSRLTRDSTETVVRRAHRSRVRPAR